MATQIKPWDIEAKSIGQTKLILSDLTSKMYNTDNEAYLPSVTLNVVDPAYMNLELLPHKNWITTLYQPIAVVAEIYDRYANFDLLWPLLWTVNEEACWVTLNFFRRFSHNHKILIGPYSMVTINVDKSFTVVETTRNGSYVHGYTNQIGIVHVNAEFSSVRTNENRLIQFKRIVAKADILVYPELIINPAEIAIPWDPIHSTK